MIELTDKPLTKKELDAIKRQNDTDLQEARRRVEIALRQWNSLPPENNDWCALEHQAAILHCDAVYLRVTGLSYSDLQEKKQELEARGYVNDFLSV